MYPIMNLRRYRKDIHWYLRALEETVIRTLRKLGLTGERVEGLTGVWVEGRKVAVRNGQPFIWRRVGKESTGEDVGNIAFRVNDGRLGGEAPTRAGSYHLSLLLFIIYVYRDRTRGKGMAHSIRSGRSAS